jgi:hypothetical protein
MRSAFVVALLLVVATATGRAEHPAYHYELLYELKGVDVVESLNDFSHNKGDAGATIDLVHIYLRNNDGKPHTLRIKKLEWVHGHCNSQKWADRKTLAIRGDLEMYTDGQDPVATGSDKIVMPEAKDVYSLHASFKSFQAYNECDRFAFAIQLELDGKVTSVELESKITRIEPKN